MVWLPHRVLFSDNHYIPLSPPSLSPSLSISLSLYLSSTLKKTCKLTFSMYVLVQIQGQNQYVTELVYRSIYTTTSTVGRLPGQNIQGTVNTGKNMLRPSSCSGVTTADMMMMMMIYNYPLLRVAPVISDRATSSAYLTTCSP